MSLVRCGAALALFLGLFSSCSSGLSEGSASAAEGRGSGGNTARMTPSSEAPAGSKKKKVSEDKARQPKKATQAESSKSAGSVGALSVDAPEHCPAGMVYVEGEYCTDSGNDAKPDEHGNTPGGGAADIDAIERVCKREWYAEQNKKRVCEEFENKGTCRGKFVKKRFCIDRYAWPNEKGVKPEVMNRFHQAQVKCAAEGKRLCTESEWTFACEGPEMLPFPYGTTRDVKKCHGDEEWDSPNMSKVAARDEKELRRLYKGKRSGQPECVSDFGVYDLPGNTDEIAASETFDRRSKFDSVTTGGPWYKGVRNQCRPKIYTHDEGFYYYYLSFRCCAEAGGAETDPRTPKQRKDGWDMKRVERIAGITVEEMREMLKKKKTDATCGCKTTRCRTFCGTLHGDDWQAGD